MTLTNSYLTTCAYALAPRRASLTSALALLFLSIIEAVEATLINVPETILHSNQHDCLSRDHYGYGLSQESHTKLNLVFDHSPAHITSMLKYSSKPKRYALKNTESDKIEYKYETFHNDVPPYGNTFQIHMYMGARKKSTFWPWRPYLFRHNRISYFFLLLCFIVKDSNGTSYPIRPLLL